MNMKKILSLVLSVILCLSVFAGCGGAKTEETKAPAAENAAAQTQAPAQEEPAELEGEITFWHSFTQGPRL